MSAPNSSRLRGRAVGLAAVLGLLADALVNVPGRPGLNVALWAIAGVGALWLLAREREPAVSRETAWLVGGAVLFAGMLVLRDADALAVLSLFSAVLLLGLAAGRAAFAWARRASFVDLAASALRVGVLSALGPLGWGLGDARRPADSVAPGRAAWTRHALTFARGAAMALLPLIVLGALLASADPVFESVLHAALFIDLEPLLEHLLFAAVIGWLTAGWLRAFLVSDAALTDRVHLPRPALPPSELAVALWLLNALFITFMIVQIRYLFGGAGLVEVTQGLSYAEYARRGFFELVAAAALVVPVLLVADWAAAEDSTRGRHVLRATSTLLILLLCGVLASAAYRMRLYQQTYGLTELRLYVSVFMVWLTVVFGWFVLTVLRGRRRGFASGALAAGFAAVIVLHLLNPHALIARVNLDRAADGAEHDVAYLRSLSGDVVPTLVDRLPALPVAERCSVVAMLGERWAGERTGGWRAWNLGDARARAAVRRMEVPAECGIGRSPHVPPDGRVHRGSALS